MADREEHPVAAGLVALVGVGLAVGLIAGLAALVGTRLVGLDGESASTRTSSQQSMYLPKPKKTKAAKAPLITLAPGATSKPGGKPSDKETADKPARKEISLSASQTEVAPMGRIDLTGIYPGGEGAILQVQRFTSGSWQDFPVTVSVSDETFSTYVQTSQGGVTRFRVTDTDTDRVSNEVRVKIG